MKPVIFRGNVVEDYFACRDGYIWSSKQGELKKLKPSTNRKQPYPTIGLQINGKKKTEYVHRLVCETYKKRPRPKDIPKKDWDITPESSRQYIYKNFHVNHIDHDIKNSKPSNLEWVSLHENNRKYQIYRKSK